MSHNPNEVPRIIDNNANAQYGSVKWNPLKSIWITSIYLAAFIGGYYYFTWPAFAFYLISTAAVLCFGHSLGMHRRLIHNSFETPLWLECIMVYMGVMVGLGGPFTMIRTHDMRDWAQRQKYCHDYFAHRQKFWKDYFWQIHCDIKLDNPPEFEFEANVVNSRFYKFIEKTAMLQPLPWMLLFYVIGGWPLVFWGVYARIATTVTGHWLIGYFAHSDDAVDWHVTTAGVQGHNVKFTGLITMGECWHNNHHAFPGSAKIGIYEGQADPGWWVLKALEKAGLAWNIQTHENLPKRQGLYYIGQKELKASSCIFSGKALGN